MPDERPPVAGLPPEALYRACDPAALRFASTRDVEASPTVVGQERALAAPSLGTRIDRLG
jgi:hypothetical protein